MIFRSCSPKIILLGLIVYTFQKYWLPITRPNLGRVKLQVNTDPGLDSRPRPTTYFKLPRSGVPELRYHRHRNLFLCLWRYALRPKCQKSLFIKICLKCWNTFFGTQSSKILQSLNCRNLYLIKYNPFIIQYLSHTLA